MAARTMKQRGELSFFFYIIFQKCCGFERRSEGRRIRLNQKFYQRRRWRNTQ